MAPYDYDYDYDKKATEHQRLWEQLGDLLRSDPTLRRRVDLKLLPQRIPGYTRTGTVIQNEETEQEAAARKIAFYLGGTIITYGVNLKNLVRTRILLTTICDPQDPLMPLREINMDGPKQDAKMVHFLAATIAGLIETTTGRFTAAETFFDDALKDATALREAAPSSEEALSASIIPVLKLLKATSIVRQISLATSSAERADVALRILKEVMHDPASVTLVRTSAAISTGKLWRNLSQYHADPDRNRPL